MSGWVINYYYGGSNRDISGSYRNVTGTPVLSAVLADEQTDGAANAIAGIYRFTFESGTTVSVEAVYTEDVGNPLLFSGTRSVTVDDVTENENILPGWEIVFSSALSTGDIFEIGVGCYWDSTNSEWVRVLPRGPVIPDLPTGELSLVIENDSGGTLVSSKLVATNAARIENDQDYNRPFLACRQTGLLDPDQDSDLLGSAVTFTNFSAGSPNTVDILVDGSPIDVYDVTGSALITNGVGLKCDDTNIYRFADTTKFQSLEFVLSSSLTGSDTATIYVSDGGDAVQLALVGGNWISGTTGVDLTEDGESVTGTVTDGGTVTVRLRLYPASDQAAYELNLRSFSLRAYGVSV